MVCPNRADSSVIAEHSIHAPLLGSTTAPGLISGSSVFAAFSVQTTRLTSSEKEEWRSGAAIFYGTKVLNNRFQSAVRPTATDSKDAITIPP